ncbi:hypothetical protein RND81_13G044100 [Saponaria officinalis]|uniref:Cytochrome P450 n=1 Tax=Saponaria officinalis TaxID=3572 RepID=A0AAW1GWS7_SAPOF
MDYLNIMLYLAVAVVGLALHEVLHFLLPSLGKKDKKLPPGPPGVPVFGNMFGIGSMPHVKFTELSKTYGPLMSIQLGRQTTVIISSPGMLQAALKNDILVSNRYIIEAVTPQNHHEKSVGFLPVGPKWRTLRKICNSQIFSNSKLENTQYIRRKVVRDLASFVKKSSENGDVVDINLAAFTSSLNLLSNTIFSVDLGASTEIAVEFRDTSHTLIGELGKPNLADYFPFLKKFDPHGIKRRSDVHIRKLLDLFNNLIQQRLDGKRPPGTKKGDDVLDALLDIVHESHDFDISDIPHLFMDLFAGGTDTTSTLVEWVMSELIRNPEKMKKAQAELREVIGKGNPVEESDISRLPYLQAVVKESFRIHPPVPLSVPRKTVSDVNLFGFTVPKDTQVLVNNWGMGRDPNLWENPLSFEPERFLNSEIDFRGRDFELMPFGSGRRICPGLPLANRMVHLLLAAFIHGFEWKLENGISPDDLNMDEKFGITLERAQHLRAIPVPI